MSGQERTQPFMRLTNLIRSTGFGHIPRLVALLAIASLPLGACSKQKERAALQTALDELTKLDSYTQTGVSYAQYSDRLVTARAHIDVALQRSTDPGAKAKIEAALQHYIQARDWWKEIGRASC